MLYSQHMADALLQEIDSARDEIAYATQIRSLLEKAESVTAVLSVIAKCREEFREQAAATLTMTGSTFADLRAKMLPLLKKHEEDVIRVNAPAALEECEVLTRDLNGLLVTLKRAVSPDDLEDVREKLYDVNKVSLKLWQQLRGNFGRDLQDKGLPDDWKDRIERETRRIIGVLHAEMQKYRAAMGQ